ncbi:MAG: hypothetical protein AB7G48_01675 [Nitrospiraceae bacterium]
MSRMTGPLSLVPAILGMFALSTLVHLPREADGETPLPEWWIDKLTGFTLIQKGIEREGSYDPYLGQLFLVRHTLRSHDLRGTYVAINRFMDMLETREGGIRSDVAEAIWDLCYQVTPTAFHDEKRHKRRWDKTVDWENFFWGE